jgi:hypothetical protein
MRYSFSAKTYPLCWSYHYRIIRSLCLWLNPRFETMIRIAGVEELTHSNRGSVGASATQWPLPWSLLGSGKALSTGEVIKKRGSSKV